MTTESVKAKWFQEVTIPTEPTPTAILVTDVAPAATKANLEEFFSFCGEIAQLELIAWVDPDTNASSQRAFVQFKHEPAARTALLLNHAAIADQAITIAPYFENLPPQSPVQAQEEDGDVLAMVDSQPLFEAHITQEDKPKQNIVADLLQRGYRLGDKIMADAERFDDAHGLSSRFKTFFSQARARGVEFNERYQVVQRSQSAFETAKTKAAALVNDVKQLDQKYHVTDRFAEFASATSAAAAEVATNIDKKYHIKERAAGVATAATNFASKVMNGTTPGEESEEQIQEEKSEIVTEEPKMEETTEVKKE